MHTKTRKKLSQSILDMKFMKKSKEKAQREAENARGQSLYSNEITDAMRKNENIFIKISFCFCKNVDYGRLSFSGMNPEVEKRMVNIYNQKVNEASKHKEKEIADVEMAKGYSTVNTINKKFIYKKYRNQRTKVMQSL